MDDYKELILLIEIGFKFYALRFKNSNPFKNKYLDPRALES